MPAEGLTIRKWTPKNTSSSSFPKVPGPVYSGSQFLAGRTPSPEDTADSGVLYRRKHLTDQDKDLLLDIGEESSPGVYSGPIYPNRDYKVFMVLPEAADREIIYRVESWERKDVEFPPFQ